MGVIVINAHEDGNMTQFAIFFIVVGIICGAIHDWCNDAKEHSPGCLGCSIIPAIALALAAMAIGIVAIFAIGGQYPKW